MKRIFFMAGVVLTLASCGGANDGDASTDTTSMPIDTAGMNAGSNINSNTGSYPTDTTQTQTDVRSSSPSDPNSRTSTPGNTGTDTGRRQ